MLKLKVCGLKEQKNLNQVVAFKPDMIGLIFYEGSERDATNSILDLPSELRKVGVFVDSEPLLVETMIEKFNLDAIQLYHANLLPFQHLRGKVEIIKAISIANEKDLDVTKELETLCDTFLFDAKGKKAGGNGIQFNWDIIRSYIGNTPFILSGGIGPDDAHKIRTLSHRKLIGIDINSRFESEPGIKNSELIKQFKNELYENIEYTR